MAHIYAGILGPLAFMASVARGMAHGGGTQSVLFNAWCALLLFSAVGWVTGWIAEHVVEDSVRGRIAAELAAEKANETAGEKVR